MADPILHIKDGYFFEVPKAVWRYNFTTREEVQEHFPFIPTLIANHPDATAADFSRGLSGKVIIPQPFATLKNLHDKESGFAISKFMILEVVIGILLVAMFSWLSQRIVSGGPPRGRLWNLIESILLFVRDEVATPAMGKHEAERFTPLLWTMFFFVLFCNLFGMLPWLGAPTGAFGVTFGLACVTFGTTLAAGMKQFGFVGFWKNLVPHMDLPWWLQPLKLPIFAIELLSLVIKHVILSVRLLANMVAGHLVLLGILGLITVAAQYSISHWLLVSGISVVSSTLLSLLELFVAFLQAYIFTFLSALFIGAAVHHH
ncbi:MAG TPA: F0F1 ATP synthase subunit A [Pirellulales bacterium]|nr:F0F1 ATP synthase subunit A [Pirellulales bacterium]